MAIIPDLTGFPLAARLPWYQKKLLDLGQHLLWYLSYAIDLRPITSTPAEHLAN
jgi:hypothetical protein